jgi:hemerythrin-like metal-binding protein
MAPRNAAALAVPATNESQHEAPNEAALRPIVWSEAFHMGDAAVDAEHQHFIDIVNRLNAAIRDHADPADIAAICDSLVTDAAEHFASEEAAMARHGFGGLPAHRREHRRLLAFIRSAAGEVRIAATRTDLVDGALAIKDALLTHIFRVDVHYKTHFLESQGR